VPRGAAGPKVTNDTVGRFALSETMGTGDHHGMSTTESNRVRALSRPEILKLLAARGTCSVAVTDRALPVVVPALYVLAEEKLYIKAADGTTLARTAPGRVVGVGVHTTELDSPPYWSLSLTAVAEIVPLAEHIGVAQLADLQAWQDGQDGCVVLSLSTDLAVGSEWCQTARHQ